MLPCLAPPSSHLTLFHDWNLAAAFCGFLDPSDRKDKHNTKEKGAHSGISDLIILTADGKISSKILELLTFPGLA